MRVIYYRPIGDVSSPEERQIHLMVLAWLRHHKVRVKPLFNFRPDWLISPHSEYPMELDIYIPSLRLAIEVNGSHHRNDLKYSERDIVKRQECKRRHIDLYQIAPSILRMEDGIQRTYEMVSSWLDFAVTSRHLQKGRGMASLARVLIYTDGACSGNPDPGAYAVILKHQGTRKEFMGSYRKTTNNRMELMGPIVGLEALRRRCEVTVYGDSRYVVDGIEKGWAMRWRSNGWRLADKRPAQNRDLCQRLLNLLQRHQVNFIWIPSHSGNEENEKCNLLAVQGCQSLDLLVDHVYEGTSQVK
jgi:ribonuclease HI